MAEPKAVRFDIARSAWLGSLQLTDVAVTAYSGEVMRLSHYCATKDVSDVRDLKERHWIDYVHSLTQPRNFLSPPRKALKPASAVQAIRITRAFLIHCAQQKWIRWDPRAAHVDQPLVRRTASPGKLPQRVRHIVAGVVQASSEREARRNFVIALSFWGGLTPRELAELKVRHQGKDQNRLTPPHRKRAVELPPPFADLWHQYREHRARNSEVKPSSPLISSLRSSAPVSAWTIWSILKDDQTAPGLGTRHLRTSYVTLATADASREMELARRQTGKAPQDRMAAARDAAQLDIQRLNQRMLNSLRQ